MSYEIGTATNAANLLDKLNTFLTTKGKAHGAVFAGTGNGTFTAWDGGASSLSETFTITATSPTAFSVVGSTSGSIGTATAGTPFVHAKLRFTITAGATPFVIGDNFKINTSPAWTSLRAVAGSEMIWQAPGNGGDRQIFTGAKLFSDAGADYYNWRLNGYTGFAAGNDFGSQPGSMGATQTPIVTLWNTTIPYWFVANGQRVIVYAKIGSIYACCYLGLYNSYLSPGQAPYPLLVGGNMAWNSEPAASSVNWRYSYTGNEMHSFWRGYPSSATTTMTYGAARFRDPMGVFRLIEGYAAPFVVGVSRGASDWPFACENSSGTASGGFMDIRENLDGSYPLIPIFFASDDASVSGVSVNTWGELDGVRATTGHANASENTITEKLITHVVFQDTTRTSKDAFCALALD